MSMGLFLAIFVGIVFFFQVIVIPIYQCIVIPLKESIYDIKMRRRGWLIAQEHPEFLSEAIQHYREIVYESIDSPDEIIRKVKINQVIDSVIPRIPGAFTKSDFNVFLNELNYYGKDNEEFLRYLARLDEQNNPAYILDKQTKMQELAERMKKYEIDAQIKDLNDLDEQIDTAYEYARDNTPSRLSDESLRMVVLREKLRCTIQDIQNDLTCTSQNNPPITWRHDPPGILEKQIRKSIYDPIIRRRILSALRFPPQTMEEIWDDSWIDTDKYG